MVVTCLYICILYVIRVLDSVYNITFPASELHTPSRHYYIMVHSF